MIKRIMGIQDTIAKQTYSSRTIHHDAEHMAVRHDAETKQEVAGDACGKCGATKEKAYRDYHEKGIRCLHRVSFF